jgi:hypothetical protein
MGDIDGAEEVLLAAHRAGWDPEPGLAMVRLAQGDVAAAAASIRDALENPVPMPSKERPPHNDLQRAPLLEAQVEIGIVAGELDRSRSAADELELIAARFESKALVASARLARARVQLADGDRDAGATFADAVRLWSEIGAPYEVAIARIGLADAHRAAGNDRRAELEMLAARAALDSIEARHAAIAGAAPADVVHDRPPGLVDVIRREGDFWSVTFDGRTVHVRDVKGMHYLARLLVEPGRELHVLDLVAAESGPGVHVRATAHDGEAHGGPGDAGEILDARAKDAYRRRLAEIDDDIDEARANVDTGRLMQAEAERDVLVQELARAFGLHGRERRAASTSERARVGVTRALRHAIARIAEHHRPLGEHLARTVRTGTYCAYVPDPRAPGGWTS